MPPERNNKLRCTSVCPPAHVMASFPPFSSYGPMVKIIVGPTKKEFQVHKGLISHHSSYFRAAYEGQFEEGLAGVVELDEDEPDVVELDEDKPDVVELDEDEPDVVKMDEDEPDVVELEEDEPDVVELEEDEPDVVEAFITWLYTRRLSRVKNAKSTTLLYSIFIFADVRDVPALKVTIIDLLFDQFVKTTTYHLDWIPYVYENTPTGSGLRKFMVDKVVLTFSIRDVLESYNHEDAMEILPQEFLLEYAIAVDKRGGKKRYLDMAGFSKIDRCAYHEHPPKDAECKQQ